MVRPLPSEFSIDSPICGHKTNVTATKKPKYAIGFQIRSTCKMINEYATLLIEMSMKEVAKPIISNPMYIKASEARVHSNCLVPCGVAFAAWAEAELIAKSLLSHHRSQCIVCEKFSP